MSAPRRQTLIRKSTQGGSHRRTSSLHHATTNVLSTPSNALLPALQETAGTSSSGEMDSVSCSILRYQSELASSLSQDLERLYKALTHHVDKAIEGKITTSSSNFGSTHLEQQPGIRKIQTPKKKPTIDIPIDSVDDDDEEQNENTIAAMDAVVHRRSSPLNSPNIFVADGLTQFSRKIDQKGSSDNLVLRNGLSRLTSIGGGGKRSSLSRVRDNPILGSSGISTRKTLGMSRRISQGSLSKGGVDQSQIASDQYKQVEALFREIGYGGTIDNASHRSRLFISPTSRFRTSLEFIINFIIVFQIFSVPFQVAFGIEPSTTSIYFSILLLFDLIYIFEIFVNFFTGYYERSVLVVTLSMIRRHYFKTFFLFDVVTSFPFDVLSVISNNNSTLWQLSLIRLLKIVNFYMNSGQISQMIASFEYRAKSDRLSVGLSVTKLLLVLFVVCHLAACLWWAVGVSGDSDGVDGTWVKYYELEDRATYTQYMNSLYFMVLTMTTVGYGDVTAQNDAEKLFTVFAMLVAGALFAIITGTLCSFILTYDEYRSQFRGRLKSAVRYMGRHNIDSNLQLRVREYLESLFLNELNKNSRRDLMALLSSSLQNEISFALMGKTLEKYEWFLNLPRAVLGRIGAECETVYFAPGDVIFYYGDPADDMFILMKGNVLEFDPTQEAIDNTDDMDHLANALEEAGNRSFSRRISNRLSSSDLLGIGGFFTRIKEVITRKSGSAKVHNMRLEERRRSSREDRDKVTNKSHRLSSAATFNIRNSFIQMVQNVDEEKYTKRYDCSNYISTLPNQINQKKSKYSGAGLTPKRKSGNVPTNSTSNFAAAEKVSGRVDTCRRVVGEGDYIGDYALFVETNRLTTAVCTSFCELLKISRNQFTDKVMSQVECYSVFKERCAIFAVKLGMGDLLDELLSEGISPILSDDNNVPLIHLAVAKDEELVSILIDKGVDMTVVDFETGALPVHVAIRLGSDHCFYMVSKHTPEYYLLHVKDKSGNTAIDLLLDVCDSGLYSQLAIVSVEEGYVDVLNELFKKDIIDVNTTDGDGLSLIHLASREGRVDALRLLKSLGARVDMGSLVSGQLPVVLAILNNKPEAVEELLGIDCPKSVFSVVDRNGDDVLSVACGCPYPKVRDALLIASSKHGLIDFANKLLSYKANVNSQCQKMSYTSLHYTIIYGHLSLCRILIDSGANISNDSNEMRNSPLHLAVENGQTTVISRLLSDGVQLHSRANSEGKLPIDIANDFGSNIPQQANGSSPIERSPRGSPELRKKALIDLLELYDIYRAIDTGDVSTIQSILTDGHIDINATHGTHGLTPLCYSVIKKDLKAIRFLVRNGAKVNKVPRGQLSPLGFSVILGQIEIAKVLIDRNAKINLLTSDGNNALHLAVSIDGNDEMLKYLLSVIYNQSGDSPNDTTDLSQMIHSKNDRGLSPLGVAIHMGNISYIPLFKDHLTDDEFDECLTDSLGSTNTNILHQYASCTDNQKMRFMLTYYPNQTKRLINEQVFPSGNTALHICIQMNNLEGVKLLVEKQANLKIKNSFNKTPIDISKAPGVSSEINACLVQYLPDSEVRGARRKSFFIMNEQNTSDNQQLAGKFKTSNPVSPEEFLSSGSAGGRGSRPVSPIISRKKDAGFFKSTGAAFGLKKKAISSDENSDDDEIQRSGGSIIMSRMSSFKRKVSGQFTPR